jgi:hypothetical protein
MALCAWHVIKAVHVILVEAGILAKSLAADAVAIDGGVNVAPAPLAGPADFPLERDFMGAIGAAIKTFGRLPASGTVGVVGAWASWLTIAFHNANHAFCVD